MGAKTEKNEVPELFKICVAAQFLNTLDFLDVYINIIYTYTSVSTYIHTTRHMIALTLGYIQIITKNVVIDCTLGALPVHLLRQVSKFS